MIAIIRQTYSKRTIPRKYDTEQVQYAPVYLVTCSLCNRSQMAIDLDEAVLLRNEHAESSIPGICVKDHPTVDVMTDALSDIFNPHILFSYEKYLLYKKKTEEFQPLAPHQVCICPICIICWNPVASISVFENGVFEQISLTMNCLDCFVICGDRKKGW